MHWWHVLLWVFVGVIVFDAVLFALLVYTGRDSLRGHTKPKFRIVAHGDEP